MGSLVLEKAGQATGLLEELGIDAWLTFARETSAQRDPVLSLIYGPGDLTWQSALLFSRGGERVAIVGRYEVHSAEQVGVFDRVIGYDESIRKPLMETLAAWDPQGIAINWSMDDPHADGLSHGLYLALMDLLVGTPYIDRLLSAERLITALRARKTPAEVERIRAAVDTTRLIYERALDYARPGLSERDVSDFMHGQMADLGVDAAWEYGGCPIVNAGPESAVGHGAPGDLLIERGQILHIDFGVMQDDYCSDIQRVAYFLAEDEAEPPEPVARGFATVRAAIEAAVAACKPGARGVDVDAAARKVIVEAGYPEFKYATGHGLGRNAHDGGPLLGPAWERYGASPMQTVEVGHVYTIEPGLEVPGYGYIGLEEDVLVTEDGAVYLGEPQRELIVK
jgi:Xaa-Pro aminopeptidase